MNSRPRIAIAGFQHESNTFAPFGAEFRDFEMADGWPALARGSTIIDTFTPLNIPIGGFMRSTDIDCVPIVWASAEPCGPVSDDAFERMSALICDGLVAAGSIDGIYLDLHGAMVTESYEDGEGELLRRIREAVGPYMPIAVSLDLHANISAAMVQLSDAMAIYRTYPHVDMAQTGVRSRALLLERVRKQQPFEKSFRQLPFLIPLSAQSTDVEPLRSIYGALGEFSSSKLSVDFACGFPAADIYDCGPAVIAYGYDGAEVRTAVNNVCERLLAAETEFVNPLLKPSEAVAAAIEKSRTGKPVILADVQDNPGAGATSDTTTLLRALVDAKADNVALGLLWNPKVASQAHAAGVGAELFLEMGSRYGYDAEPFPGRYRVEALSDGEIVGGGTIAGGLTMSLGQMVHLRLLDSDAEVRVIVCSVRFQCLDQALFRALGVEPSEQAILVVKSTVHFRADFAPIASDILMVEAPGANVCRPENVAYKNLRPGVRLRLRNSATANEL